MTSIGHDLRYGARSLVKNPGFTLLAAGTLALGIGVNTTIFSLVNTLLFAELPITDPDTFGLVEAVSTESNDTESPATLADFALLTEDTNVFVDTAVAVRKHFVLTGEGEPAYVQALSVSANYFELWGVGTVLGRGFADGEDRPGAPPVTVLSHGFWTATTAKTRTRWATKFCWMGSPIRSLGSYRQRWSSVSLRKSTSGSGFASIPRRPRVTATPF